MLVEDSESAAGIEPDSSAILVFVDFSEGSRRALAFAADLAADLGAPLHVVHIIHDPADAPGYYQPSEKKVKKTLARLEDSARELMATFVADTKDRCHSPAVLSNARLRLHVGLVVPRMVEVTASLMPRIVVVGSYGRTNFGDLLLGSKATQFVRLSPAPTLVVKEEADVGS